MANEKNLKPFTSAQSREIAVRNGKKGGLAKGKNHRKKVELQKVVRDMLNSKASRYPVLAQIAEKYGIDGTITVKELISLGAMLKAAADGSAGELLKLMEIIGENGTDGESNSESHRDITFIFADTSSAALKGEDDEPK